MSRSLIRLILTASILAFTVFAFGDEGMWLPHQMKDLDLENRGLKMAPTRLYKEDGTGIMNAVVRVARGGTGAFVSKEGLILTNHHVAFSAVQRASDQDHDYLANGFLAQNKTTEIPALGYFVYVLLGYDDVTPVVLKQLKPGLTPAQRYKILDRLEKKLVAAAEKQGNDIVCDFKPMYDGNKYYLFKFKRLMDVRIVYAPPQAIGNFGGEIDNWMWPRHTGDFTFLRAYVSPENEGVPYNTANVPYHPTSFLNISLAGVKEGDFTFSMGYPGTTRRNYSYAEFQWETETMRQYVDKAREVIAFFEKAGENHRDIQIKYAPIIRTLGNGMKNRQAKLEGFQKHAIPEKKQRFDDELMQWIRQQPDGRQKYGNITADIHDFMQRNSDFYQKLQLLSDLGEGSFSSALLGQAYLIFRTVTERQKPDQEREKTFQERDLPDIKMRIEVAERMYHLDTDKAYLKFMLKKLSRQGKSTWPKALVPVLEKSTEDMEKYIDQLYASTILTSPDKRLALIDMKLPALLALNDPLIKLAASMDEEAKVLREKEKILIQERSDLKKVYLAALLAKTQGKIAPDANATIRFTFGTVKRYQPRDGVTFLAFTTLKGIMEKERDSLPFLVPGKLKQLYRDRDFGRYMAPQAKDIVTCFINTICVTGGSSGSPVLNANGEMIGISFDMVFESVVGDFYIVPEFQRVINVDIRYVMFITDKFAGASYLLAEMGLE